MVEENKWCITMHQIGKREYLFSTSHDLLSGYVYVYRPLFNTPPDDYNVEGLATANRALNNRLKWKELYSVEDSSIKTGILNSLINKIKSWIS